MKKFRSASLLLALLLAFSVSHAQLGSVLPTSGLRSDLQKVLEEYPHGFAGIRGAVRAENPQSTEFACTLNAAGAESSSIFQYSGAKATYAWQATLLTTEEFDVAVKKYRALYQQIKGMTVRMNRDYTYRLAGDYETPDESRKFTTSTFVLLPSATNLPKVRVELSLQFYFPEWKVELLVYEKEREDDERGETEEY